MRKPKRTYLALICVVLLFSALLPGFSQPSADSGQAGLTPIPIYVDGILIATGTKIDVTTYISLRSYCSAMGRDAEISWDQVTGTATAKLSDVVITATVGEKYMTANGRCFYLPDGVKNIGGSVMVPIREIAKVFGTPILWHAHDWSISIETSDIQLLEGADSFYNQEDLYWLGQIIYAESGNQCLEGKIGVGNVVLNRVKDPGCPDTIVDVIFDDRYGVQFTPTVTGTIYDPPNEESLIAAMICLEGYEVAGDSLYFLNPEVGINGWFAENRAYVTTIGEHTFYA